MSGAPVLPSAAPLAAGAPPAEGVGPAAPALSRREAVMGGLMLAAAAGALWATPRRFQSTMRRGEVLEKMVPTGFAGWAVDSTSGLVLPPADQLRDQVYSDLVTRTYVRPGSPPVMLLVAYGGSQGGLIQVHRPEVCYPAGGYRLPVIAAHETRLAPGVAVQSRYILAESDQRSEQIIYWTRLGSHFPRSWAEQRFAVLEENLVGNVPDGVLVRMSTLAPGPVEALLDGFAAELYRASGPGLRDVLLGGR